jgi:quercetin dioxygenase-like cupin family protein
MSTVRRLDSSADPEQTLRASGLKPYSWSAGPGATFPPHTHAQTKHLYVTSGSIDFDGLALRDGEGIIIPAGTEHSATAGAAGVTCVEAFD